MSKPRRDGGTDTVGPVTQAFSFTGHETFVFRYGWLIKAVIAVADDPAIFGRDDAIVTLGVGKNMVRSIRHWALATGVVEEDARSRGTLLHVSDIGGFLFGPSGRDTFLEDPGTLWLLHWQLLSHPTKSSTWKWAFFGLRSNEFTRTSLSESLIEVASRTGTTPSEASVKRDVEVFVRTYLPSRSSSGLVPEESLDCPLVELDLLQDAAGVYRFARGAKDALPDAVFALAVSEYWQRAAPDRETLSFTDLLYGFGSPGSAFKLDENSLVERLERLGEFSDGDFSYSETAGIKQLYRHKQRPSLSYLRKHFRHAATPELLGV